MTDEKIRQAARTDVETALREAADLAAHSLPSPPRNEEIVALAAVLLDAYHWRADRSRTLTPDL